jgi:hypothetical protein
MKTPGNQIQILYDLFMGSDLKIVTPGKITGDVYKVARPSSGKEDVVIKSLSLVGQTKQFGSAVVNIWIPDRDLQDQSFPNTERIDELAAKAIELIENTLSTDYNMTIGNQGIFSEPEMKYHFFSITVNFEFFNL